ncbi:hypothetical protein Angca_001910, partial [Angiostrongylus cantonensis]
ASTCFYLPNINLKGGTYDEFNASDITQCCIQCASQPCCAGYTYSKALKRCYMKSSINYSEQEDMMISGIRANANGGVGARMKNVKIEGSGGSRITLENSEECQQYCTVSSIHCYSAFGVYSWSPPRYDDGSTSGECSCMKRITAVRYHFGSQAAIFPTVANL